MQVRLPLLPRELRWLGVVAIAAVIFYGSILAVPPETIIDTRFEVIPLDKWRHFVAYATLGVALAYATADWDISPRLGAGLVLGTVILYGLGIEVVQLFLPQRYFSLGDAYANALGGVLVTPWYLIEPHIDFVTPETVVSTLLNRTN